MAYTGAYAVSNEWLGLGIETTRGTPVPPTYYIPHLTPGWDPKLSWLHDDAFRGSPVFTYDEVPGVRYDELGFKFYMRPTDFVWLLVALLGGSDVKTGSSAPYKHTVGLFNTASLGSQPPSFTLVWFDGHINRRFTYGVLVTFVVTFMADGKVEVATKWITGPETTATTTYTPVFTTEHMVPGWDYKVTIGSTTMPNVISGEIKGTRDTKPIFTGGKQTVFQNFAGDLDFTGKLVVVLTRTDATILHGLERSEQASTITFKDPATTHTVAFTMAALQLENPSEKPGKKYVEVTTDWQAVANTTDAVTPGWSSVKGVVENAISTSIYTKPTPT